MNALTGLPQIAPAEAQLRGDLLAALNGLEVGATVLTAALPEQVPQLAWFVCTGSLAFALERLEAEPLRLQSTDGVSAAELLDRADPLLRAIEWALDIELEPESLGASAGLADRLCLRIEASQGRTVRDRLFLAIPRDLALIAKTAPFAPSLLDTVPFPTRLAIAGPRLTPTEAADLAAGDLLLIGETPLSASLHFLDQSPVAGFFDPAARGFTPLDANQE